MLIKIESLKNMLSLLIKIKNEKYGDKIKEEEKEVKNDNNELKQKNKLREIANTIILIDDNLNIVINIFKINDKEDLFLKFILLLL